MKKKLAGLVAVLGCVATLAAQTYDSRELMHYNNTNRWGTNIIVPASAGLSANTNRSITNSVVGTWLSSGATTEVHLKFQLRGAGTGDVVFGFQKSYDGQTWYDAEIVGKAATGNTAVEFRTNITMGYYGFLKIYDIDNTANSTAVTNLNIRYTSSRFNQ